MSLLHESIQNKKFDTRMLEKNLVRNVVSDKEVKTFVEQLPDDAENAAFISLDEIEQQ
jgi:nitrogen regulatory protein PII